MNLSKLPSLLRILCLILALASSSGCGKKKPVNNNAKQKAAAKTDAIKQYKMLVAKYPDSKFVAQAKERLQALAPGKK